MNCMTVYEKLMHGMQLELGSRVMFPKNTIIRTNSTRENPSFPLRFKELDSLRGLAALTVMFHHYLLVLPSIFPYNGSTGNGFVRILTFTPVHLLWAGYEAVILFFILSGYVLSLPYHQGRQEPYRVFLIKRFCRIYLPYVSAIILAIILSALLQHGRISGLSTWFNNTWTTFSWNTVMIHLTLLGHWYNTSTQLDPVVWSLTYEMQMSIIFPIIIFVAMNIRIRLAIFLGLIGSLFSYTLPGFEFARYGLMFLIGVLLARHSAQLRERYGRLSKIKRYFLLILALLAYSSQWYWYSVSKFHTVASDWLIVVGSVGIILSVLYSHSLNRLFRLKPLVFLGKISFSVYLLHSLVMLSLVNIFFGKVPLIIILIASAILTLVLSSLSFKFLELPAISLGNNIIQKIRHKPNNSFTVSNKL